MEERVPNLELQHRRVRRGLSVLPPENAAVPSRGDYDQARARDVLCELHGGNELPLET